MCHGVYFIVFFSRCSILLTRALSSFLVDVVSPIFSIFSLRMTPVFFFFLLRTAPFFFRKEWADSHFAAVCDWLGKCKMNFECLLHNFHTFLLSLCTCSKRILKIPSFLYLSVDRVTGSPHKGKQCCCERSGKER
ncbi:hypothetical protein, unlikely [Trypanosoma congolense IL3000]|uniref:Uncharacterized protein n=1 Tax=Trypanosoma congolense (strain IL3000) TaxID=1068625 RepID=F9WFB8_TRYCI|nr:hypothetical protein, unlikely [Trypanosoma congolense IL3000]